MLDDVITDDVRASFVASPPELGGPDDLSWLDELIFDSTGESTDIRSLAAARLGQEFRAFRAGHATRTNDLAAYYEHGLRVLRADEIEARARSIFLSGRFPHATEDCLQRAIDELDARNTASGVQGSLYFCAQEDELYRAHSGAGHYLLYGSEYLYSLGIRVTSEFATKQTLREIGRPTLFVCDIPMPLVRASTLREFAGLVLEYLFFDLVEGRQAYALGPYGRSGLRLTTDVPAAAIVGHYHPAEIHDPL